MEIKLNNGSYQVRDQLYEKINYELIIENGLGVIKVKLDPLGSLILKINE